MSRLAHRRAGGLRLLAAEQIALVGSRWEQFLLPIEHVVVSFLD
ncbi:hypothetical protein AB0K05_02670 [Nonomuraea sp. NPDC049486]